MACGTQRLNGLSQTFMRQRGSERCLLGFGSGAASKLGLSYGGILCLHELGILWLAWSGFDFDCVQVARNLLHREQIDARNADPGTIQFAVDGRSAV